MDLDEAMELNNWLCIRCIFRLWIKSPEYEYN